jgi:hypothetical protein
VRISAGFAFERVEDCEAVVGHLHRVPATR